MTATLHTPTGSSSDATTALCAAEAAALRARARRPATWRAVDLKAYLGLGRAGAPDLARAAVVPRRPARRGRPGPRSASTMRKDSGPAAPPATPRAVQPARHDAGCPSVPSRPESSGPGETGRHYQNPPGSGVNFGGFAAPYESGCGSFNRPCNAITDD